MNFYKQCSLVLRYLFFCLDWLYKYVLLYLGMCNECQKQQSLNPASTGHNVTCAYCMLLLRNAVTKLNIWCTSCAYKLLCTYSVDIAVLQLMGLLWAAATVCITTKLSWYSTGKATLFLFVAGATVAAGITVLVYLKTKPCMRVHTTLCHQETGPSTPSMMVTGRDWTVTEI